jgi:heat-inducible transcriptional repressor
MMVLTEISTHAIIVLDLNNMEGLTARQTQILKALIDEYIGTAEPVGSEALEKKYNLGVSPATIRNEMVNLTKAKYLRQPYTSAGRVPTPQAMKFYINQLMEEKNMSLSDEVKAKEEVWDSRANFDKLMTEATHALANRTNSIAVATTDDGEVWKWGYDNVFSHPEFANLAVCQVVFQMLEEQKRFHELFWERMTGISPIEVLFGEELGWANFEPVSVIATRFNAGGKSGVLGVVGPFRNLIQELAG